MALPNLPQRQPGPDKRYTDPAQALQHQRQLKSSATSRPPAAPPIEAARAAGSNHHHPAGCAATITDRQQSTHNDGFVTTKPTATEATESFSAHGDEMWQKHFKHLPRGTKPVTFVGEGAANAVFEIKVPQHGLSDQNFKGLLLRVAKVPALGQTTAYNYLFQQQYYQAAILPLLGEHAIHQELVVLRGSGIVDELNRLLQDVDDTRKPKFRGSFIGQSDWGLLIEDMRPEPRGPSPRSSSSLLVEFKPKWLSQSRSAPAGAVRCRQCALELQRTLTRPPPPSCGKSSSSSSSSSGGGGGKFAPERKPCPLALVDEDAPPAVSSPFRIAPALAGTPDRDHLRTLLRRIIRDPLLDDLRAQQEALDATGPLCASADDDNFGIAMTIRDCTCFALIPKDNAGAATEDVKIRLGDLDWKDPEAKIHHWRGTEQALIDGGFYTAEWILCEGTYYHPPTLCLLEWKPRASPEGVPDIIALRDQDAEPAAAANGSGRQPRVYTLTADTAALQSKLQPYEGNDATASANPHRPAPW
ncbi:hypothetical protein PWT90_04324 [Aphanocladium album]|nr:hypothetical protein PWT90_04324 [Aphanocladium album]